MNQKKSLFAIMVIMQQGILCNSVFAENFPLTRYPNLNNLATSKYYEGCLERSLG